MLFLLPVSLICSLIRRVICFLFRGRVINDTIINMLCGGISTIETTIVAAGISIDRTKTVVFCCICCSSIARCLFYNACKYTLYNCECTHDVDCFDFPIKICLLSYEAVDHYHRRSFCFFFFLKYFSFLCFQIDPLP